MLSLSKRDLLHRKLCRTVEISILPCRWHLGSNGRIYAAVPYVLTANRLDFALGGDGWFIIAVLGATFCYGMAGNYSKTRLGHLPPRVLAAGSCAMSALVLLIPGILLWPSEPISPLAWGNAIALAVFSTTLAFLLYFGLLASAGATAASTVTFLVPVSALLWGYLLLGETLSLQIAIGMVITLLGTAVATRLLRLKRHAPQPPAYPPHE